jgi:hypothetical protein
MMRTFTTTAFLVGLLALAPTQLVACDSAPTSQAMSANRARSLAALSKSIEANPARAEALLKEAGLDTATYEAQLYEIAADPALSAAYAAAR